MGSCNLCGSEVKDVPYREPASMPEVKIPPLDPLPVIKHPKESMWNKVSRYPTLLTTFFGLLGSGCSFVGSRALHAVTAQNFSAGLFLLFMVIPAAVKLPILISNLDKEVSFKSDGAKWWHGVGLMCWGIFALIILGAIGWGGFWFIAHLGGFILNYLL